MAVNHFYAAIFLISFSGSVVAFNLEWPEGIVYKSPGSCARNESFNQNTFTCFRCGKSETPKSQGIIYI